MTVLFTDVSREGVPAPEAPAGLPDYEALSPSRRSPQARAAQRLDSRRPDRLPKQPSDA